MKKLILTTVIVFTLSSFSASAAYAGGGNELFGTLLGAGVGGFVGNQFGHGAGKVAATGVGVLAGGLIGNDLGRSVDQEEALSYDAPPYPAYGEAPVYYAASSYVPNYVAPPAPTPPPETYVEDDGSYCREFSETVRINGQVQESYGTACLQPDGSWRVVP